MSLYIGLDIHCKWTTAACVDSESGEISIYDRVPNGNEAEEMKELLRGLGPGLAGVMENGTAAWSLYWELLPYFERLVVGDAGKLWNRKTDRKAKTDRIDAERMALMLARGEIEPLYVPDERTMDLRVLVRSKVRASRLVTKLVNEVGALLRSWGYVGSRSLLSKSGRKDLKEAKLPKHSARVLELWTEMLEKAEEIERELEKAIEEESAADSECQVLQTIPGVGHFTALLLKAEIGDVRRFKTSAHLASYIGLAPRVYQSGDVCHYGRLCNWGNRWLKYGVGLLAQRIAQSRQKNPLHASYWRHVLRGHTNSAKIAVSRKAVRIIHRMLWSGEPWNESLAASRKERQAA